MAKRKTKGAGRGVAAVGMARLPIRAKAFCEGLREGLRRLGAVVSRFFRTFCSHCWVVSRFFRR